MTKYHISDAGEVVVCRARKIPCRKENFETIKEAEQAKTELFGSGTSMKGRRKPQNALRAAERFYGGDYVDPHEIELQKGVESVLSSLIEIGNPLIVGGAVRDSFEGHENKDIDIEVHGTTVDKLTEHLKKNGYTVDEVGKQFGVLKVYKKGEVNDLDVSVPRKENRVGAGHRNFEIEMDETMTIQEAAERRDFTFNAVMYDHQRKVIVDPSGGKQDFENRIMKHVSEKFAEDPLRVLRGFQFAGRFEMEIDPDTAEMCRKLLPEYKHLSTERVQEEWEKFYTKSKNPSKGLNVLKETGWDETEKGLKEVLSNHEVESALQKLPEQEHKNKVIFGAATIVRKMNNEDAENFLKKSVVGVKEQALAKTFRNFKKDEAESTYGRKKLARELARTGFTFNDFGKLSKMWDDSEGVKIAEKASAEGISTNPEPELVMGRDVMEMSNKKPGPWMGELLTKVLDKQYRGEFRNREEALTYARNNLPV